MREAAGADAALAQARRGALDVVVADLAPIPGVERSVVQDLLDEFGGLRVIAIAGQLDDDLPFAVEAGVDAGTVQVLSRPFSDRQLHDAIRQVLQEDALALRRPITTQQVLTWLLVLLAVVIVAEVIVLVLS